MTKETRVLAAAETVMELMDPVNNGTRVSESFMVPGFLMQPEITSTSVGTLVGIQGGAFSALWKLCGMDS